MDGSPAISEEVLRQLARAIPHFSFLGAEIVKIKKGFTSIKLPWKEEFIGDPISKNINPGVLYSLLDTAGGLATYSAIVELMQVATLDMRVDHLFSATVGLPIIANATCYHMTKKIAFVRITASQENNNAFAVASANFMLRSSPLVKPRGK